MLEADHLRKPVERTNTPLNLKSRSSRLSTACDTILSEFAAVFARRPEEHFTYDPHLQKQRQCNFKSSKNPKAMRWQDAFPKD